VRREVKASPNERQGWSEPREWDVPTRIGEGRKVLYDENFVLRMHQDVIEINKEAKFHSNKSQCWHTFWISSGSKDEIRKVFDSDFEFWTEEKILKWILVSIFLELKNLNSHFHEGINSLISKYRRFNELRNNKIFLVDWFSNHLKPRTCWWFLTMLLNFTYY